MQQRRGALAALCVVVLLLAAACASAAADTTLPADPAGDPSHAGAARAGDDRKPVPFRGGSDPRWQVGPGWSRHPETLPGSRRFRKLARTRPADTVQRPNVVLITTDDMTASDLRWMPRTRALIGGAGVSFADSLAPHPLCCPARAQILTGQFAQNNGVSSNRAPYGGYYRLDGKNTLPVWLRRAGYATAFMGKYLNEYGHRDPREVPPGWSYWRAPVQHVYDYYNFTVNADGELRRYDDYYQTDLYSDLTEHLVPRLARADRPFFLWQSHLAPHGACSLRVRQRGRRCWVPPTPSAEHVGVFESVRPPQRDDPSYGERDVSDKHAEIRSKPPVGPRRHAWLKEIFQRRIESLASVDDSVARTVDVLARAGELDETLLIFTSDNGFLLGEHRHEGKTVPYEPALRVPLLMRGPGLPAGVTRPATVGTLDLAPTILAATGAQPGLTVDGRDLTRVATGQDPDWDTILVLGGPESRADGPEWYYRGVRTDRYTYVEFRQTDEVELYDRRVDPHQLDNLAGHSAYAAVQRELERRLLRLQDCSGDECRRDFGPVPRPAAPVM